jgi:hypothetical protein
MELRQFVRLDGTRELQIFDGVVFRKVPEVHEIPTVPNSFPSGYAQVIFPGHSFHGRVARVIAKDPDMGCWTVEFDTEDSVHIWNACRLEPFDPFGPIKAGDVVLFGKTTRIEVAYITKDGTRIIQECDGTHCSWQIGDRKDFRIIERK